MRPSWLGLIVGLCLLLPACYRSGPPGGGSAGFDSFGHLGQTSSTGPGGTYTIKCPFSQLGSEYVLAGYLQRPEKPPAPAYLVLLRQLSATSSSEQVSTGGGGDDVAHAHQSFPAAGGERFWVRYTLAKGTAEEQLSLGDKPYSFEEGRVFLIDLRSKPVEVLQIKDDLASLLPPEAADRDDLRSVRGKLEARHERVRGFWRE